MLHSQMHIMSNSKWHQMQRWISWHCHVIVKTDPYLLTFPCWHVWWLSHLEILKHVLDISLLLFSQRIQVNKSITVHFWSFFGGYCPRWNQWRGTGALLSVGHKARWKYAGLEGVPQGWMRGPGSIGSIGDWGGAPWRKLLGSGWSSKTSRNVSPGRRMRSGEGRCLIEGLRDTGGAGEDGGEGLIPQRSGDCRWSL